MMQAQGAPTNRIAYIDAQGQVGLIAPDGQYQQQLSAAAHGFRFPTWSPDGRALVAIGGAYHESVGLYRLDPRAPTAAPQPLYTSATHRPFYAYWSPDGRFVSFLTSHPQGLALHLVEAHGQQQWLLTIGSRATGHGPLVASACWCIRVPTASRG
ncbi:MAG: hypothetical protein HC914_11650, partial [Chloroflexaceae bacterium]|nr:hypothetical protein [Chloroflexaceae bacterium]